MWFFLCVWMEKPSAALRCGRRRGAIYQVGLQRQTAVAMLRNHSSAPTENSMTGSVSPLSPESSIKHRDSATRKNPNHVQK